MFDSLLTSLRSEVSEQLSRIRPLSDEEQRQMIDQMVAQQQGVPAQLPEGGEEEAVVDAVIDDPIAGFDENDRSTWGNPGRNAPCPCGSGKKFKHCHGAV